MSDELGTVVRRDVNRYPVDLEQDAKRLMNIRRCEAPANLQGETPPSELIDGTPFEPAKLLHLIRGRTRVISLPALVTLCSA